ncbi:hypothetical protein WR25_25482 [Diploscapter pachys]|uniref:Tubulin--tyrosine ligase-like protein 5 n=1 Tax=Diploscapter pachys TaxID=2018661 RepID=A0A2A2KUK9_9BILA|nr:hypothetical protein WR25_25482 [Diploscapter pachys]
MVKLEEKKTDDGKLGNDRKNGSVEQESNRSTPSKDIEQSKKIFRLFDYVQFHVDSIKTENNEVLQRNKKYSLPGEKFKMTFKLSKCDIKLVRTLMNCHGFTQCSTKRLDVNFIWTAGPYKLQCMRMLKPWQRLNQFPRSLELTRKDKMCDNIARMQRVFPKNYNFIPKFYVLPRDAEKFRLCTEEMQANGSGDAQAKLFIVKPCNSSRGQGIFFASQYSDVPPDSPLLVSRYLNRPYLIDGHKFDLRIYVAVTSFYPLVTYVFYDGLTRLASAKYDPSSSHRDEFVHLTNYSINKNNKQFIRNESMATEDLGHKWTLGAFLRYMEREGKDPKLLMLRIEDVIIKSLLSVQGKIASICRTALPYPGTNFELFGFDILVDENLKPWLLEVNLSSSMACDAPLDSLVKSQLMVDLLNLACIPLIDRKITEKIGVQTLPANVEDNVSDIERTPEREIEIPVDDGQTIKINRPIGVRRVVKGKRNGKIPIRNSALELKIEGVMRKVKFEKERKGNFIRIFPRPYSFDLYEKVMEGIDKHALDERLFLEEFGESKSPVEESLEDLAIKYHHAILHADQFPTFDSLPSSLRKIIDSWYAEAAHYVERITKEGEIYAAKLPIIRATARLRTRSCSDWYDLRRANILAKRNAKDAGGQDANKENSLPHAATADVPLHKIDSSASAQPAADSKI